MKRKIWAALAIFCLAFTFLPDRTITGIVQDASQNPLGDVIISAKGTKKAAKTSANGTFSITVPVYVQTLVFNKTGYQTKEMSVGTQMSLNVTMRAMPHLTRQKRSEPEMAPQQIQYELAEAIPATFRSGSSYVAPSQPGTSEDYKSIEENGFQRTDNQAVTTFSVDVDRAAYSNVRRFLNNGNLPPADAVRIEEMINYFDYHFPQPKENQPLSVVTELSDSPWNKGLKLLHIGMQGKKIEHKGLPASNLVFLIDVSGSMQDSNKLPLLKQSFKMLVDQLRPQDKISIVAYAGAAGVVLEPTSGDDKMKIKEALDELEAGGSTAGGEGIEIAYKLARQNFIAQGNNRVILATDGDFNVGLSSESELQRLIEEKRKAGIFLSVMGFGMGNYKDRHMETLADKGNGNYAYIDNIQEARKEFVQEFGGTLFTIAKDVKIQLEFNPAHVQGYRLVGYENRALKNEEFHDDRKDAGDIGSGHTVTAIYEIIPAGISSDYLPKTDPLKYLRTTKSDAGKTDELLTIKVRYKKPDSDKSVLFETPVPHAAKAFASCSENFRFSAAVAEFGLLLRDSEYRGSASYDHVLRLAKGAIGEDEEGYRSEFLRLVKTAKSLDISGKETAVTD